MIEKFIHTKIHRTERKIVRDMKLANRRTVEWKIRWVNAELLINFKLIDKNFIT